MSITSKTFKAYSVYWYLAALVFSLDALVCVWALIVEPFRWSVVLVAVICLAVGYGFLWLARINFSPTDAIGAGIRWLWSKRRRA